MDNQANINKESWKQAFLILGHFMILAPMIVGFGTLLWVFYVDNNVLKTFLSAISSIGFGVAINYYSFYFKDNTKYNNLLSKITDMEKETAVLHTEINMLAQNTVETLKIMSLNIIDQCDVEGRKMNPMERGLLTNIQKIIKSYDKYYKPDFTTDLSDFIRMASNTEGTSVKRENYTTWLSPYGVINDATGSKTVNDAVFGQNDPTNFVGSRTNPPTFGQE